MDTRERLLEATRELLWERGFSATSPNDILKRANAGQGSMYHHFSGKQDLAVSALEESAQAMRAEAETLLSGSGTPSSRVIAYLQRQRDSLRGCRIGRMTYDAEVVATPDLLRPVDDTFRWLLGRIAEVLREAIDDGELPDETDARSLAAMIVATVQGGYVLARATQDPASFDAAVDGAVSLLASWSTA